MSRELVMMVTWQRSGLLKNISTQSASLISLKHPASKHVEQIEELHPNMVVQDAGSCNLYIYACLVMSLIGSLLTMLVVSFFFLQTHVSAPSSGSYVAFGSRIYNSILLY
ncbi:uncharacterized protein LOC142626971 isoform X3 [Castanea sativa]|uniref:uncharacterized protein LOC142626971 isoform X3 n=1 Tax=Castanea sativa TaxID=21020 RepID=UPI003F64C59E